MRGADADQLRFGEPLERAQRDWIGVDLRRITSDAAAKGFDPRVRPAGAFL